MWWGWPKRARIYLARGWVLLERCGKSPALARPHAWPSAGWDAALESLSHVMPSRARRLEVHVSGALAPAVTLEFPAGVSQYAERLSYARMYCASVLGRPQERFDCLLDPHHRGICTVVETDLVPKLHDWARRRHLTLDLCEPLWAHWTRRTEARALRHALLREPDSVTVLTSDEDGTTRAASLPLDSATTQDVALQRVLPMLDALGVAAPGCAWIEFSLDPSTPQGRSGTPWDGHWSWSSP